MRALGAGASADAFGRSHHLPEGRRKRWQRGAAGERATAALLEPLALAGWVVLHDRRVPGMAANIDHLVAGPSRLWVLDTKVWRGDVVRLGDGQLWYADAPVTDRIAVVARIAEAVHTALSRHPEFAGIEVRAAAVIQGAHAPELATVDGVELLQPAEVVGRMAAGTPPIGGTERLLDGLGNLFPVRTG